MSNFLKLLLATLLLLAVAQVSADTALAKPKNRGKKPWPKQVPSVASIKEVKSDADAGPTNVEVASMRKKYAAAVANIRKKGRKTKKTKRTKPSIQQARFQQLLAATTTSATSKIRNAPHPYDVWADTRLYIQNSGLNINNQWGVVGWYGPNGLVDYSNPYGFVDPLHSEQRLHNDGWFDPPAGVTDVVLYSTFSPCHARAQNLQGFQGCLHDVIRPVAEELCARNPPVHFTVIFNGRYTASGSYGWDTVWETWVDEEELVELGEDGCFSMYQINRTLIKPKKKPIMWSYFGNTDGKPGGGSSSGPDTSSLFGKVH